MFGTRFELDEDSEVTQAPMHALIAEAVDLIVSIEKIPSGSGRRIKEVVMLEGYDGKIYLTKNI